MKTKQITSKDITVIRNHAKGFTLSAMINKTEYKDVYSGYTEKESIDRFIEFIAVQEQLKKANSEWRLIGSDGTIERLQKDIVNYFYGSQIELIEVNDKLWNVKGKNGVMSHYRVIKKGKRYRFEITNNPLY